jgi:CHAD domain-containing protein
MAHATTLISADLARALRRNGAVLSSAASRARRGDERGIHRVRVATRRLREALPAASSAARRDDDQLTRRLRRVTKGLGLVRELDMSRKVLGEFAEREAWPAAVVANVDEYCKRQREQGLRDVTGIIDDLDVRDVRRDLGGVADRLDEIGERPVSSAIAALMRERARTLSQEIDGAGTLYAAEPLHRVRVATKKLRYVMELAGNATVVRRLKRLQSALGHLHDAQVLQRRMQELAAASGDRGLVATLTSMDESVENVCRQWHAAILKTLPGIGELARSLAREVPGTIGPRASGKPARMRPPRSTDGRRRARVA